MTWQWNRYWTALSGLTHVESTANGSALLRALDEAGLHDARAHGRQERSGRLIVKNGGLTGAFSSDEHKCRAYSLTKAAAEHVLRPDLDQLSLRSAGSDPV